MTPLSADELAEVLAAIRRGGVVTPEMRARWKLTKRRQQWREAQARYGRTDKGKAAHKRYRSSSKGHRLVAKSNRHRVFLGTRYHGRAKTTAQAAVINAHIKERVSAFQRQQARAEAEGA